LMNLSILVVRTDVRVIVIILICHDLEVLSFLVDNASILALPELEPSGVGYLDINIAITL
jgi:hypothetical protein